MRPTQVPLEERGDQQGMQPEYHLWGRMTINRVWWHTGRHSQWGSNATEHYCSCQNDQQIRLLLDLGLPEWYRRISPKCRNANLMGQRHMELGVGNTFTVLMDAWMRLSPENAVVVTKECGITCGTSNSAFVGDASAEWEARDGIWGSNDLLIGDKMVRDVGSLGQRDNNRYLNSSTCTKSTMNGPQVHPITEDMKIVWRASHVVWDL